jgi:hypothetical protein
MERFRPLLEPLRFDPTRFDTYLEQLGVPYPTLEKPMEDSSRVMRPGSGLDTSDTTR